MNFAEFVTTLNSSVAPMGLPLLVILGLAGLSVFMLVIFGCLTCIIDAWNGELNIAETTNDDTPPARANEDSQSNHGDGMPAGQENSAMAACMANDDQDPSCSKLCKLSKAAAQDPENAIMLCDRNESGRPMASGSYPSAQDPQRQPEYVAITIEPGASGSFPNAVAAEDPQIPGAQLEDMKNIEMKQAASDIALDVAKLEPDDPLIPYAGRSLTEAEVTDATLYARRQSPLHLQMIRPSLPPPPPPKSGHLPTPPTPPSFTSIQMEPESEFSTMPSYAAWMNKEASTSLSGMLTEAAKPEVSQASSNPPPQPPLPFEHVPDNRTQLSKPTRVEIRDVVDLTFPPASVARLLPEIVDLKAAQQEGNVKTVDGASSRIPLPVTETEYVPDYRTPEAGTRGTHGLSTSADFSCPTSYKRDVPLRRRSVDSSIAERVRIFEQPRDDACDDDADDDNADADDADDDVFISQL